MVGELGRGGRPVVLTVDDEPGVRESFRQILKEECDVLEATGGQAALAPVARR